MKIEQIDTTKLKPFADHPFKIRQDSELVQMAESIRDVGVITSILVRPIEEGYEVISRHRRLAICKELGIETVPAVIREMTNEEAVIAMVDSNLQRENVLPSEKAFAYKMKLEAIKHQGKSTSRQVVGKSESADLISDSKSGRQIQRYIRLTELLPEILQMVDESKIAFNPTVIAAAITSRQTKSKIPTHFYLGDIEELPADSIILFEQIQMIADEIVLHDIIRI